MTWFLLLNDTLHKLTPATCLVEASRRPTRPSHRHSSLDRPEEMTNTPEQCQPAFIVPHAIHRKSCVYFSLYFSFACAYSSEYYIDGHSTIAGAICKWGDIFTFLMRFNSSVFILDNLTGPTASHSTPNRQTCQHKKQLHIFFSLSLFPSNEWHIPPIATHTHHTKSKQSIWLY